MMFHGCSPTQGQVCSRQQGKAVEMLNAATGPLQLTWRLAGSAADTAPCCLWHKQSCQH